MKKDLHPDYVETTVTCTCGNTFTTRSTSASGQIHADVCSSATRSTRASRRSSTPVAVWPGSRSATARRPTPPSSSPDRRSRPGFSRVRAGDPLLRCCAPAES